MNYRRFGKTDLLVSEIGYGAWAIGGEAKVGDVQIGWGPSDDATSIRSLHTALEQGINFYDTADFYGLGHSEALIGGVFGNSDKVLIATKVGQKPGTSKPVDIDYSKAYILEACELSLGRLHRDQIDYYQLHVANISHLQQGDCIEAMELLRKQGKIRYWGISLATYNPFPEAEYILDNQLGDGFQLVFNIINQKALPLLSKMAGQGYGVIARMPLQFGLLSGKFSATTHFPVSDHRSKRLTPEIITNANRLLEQVWPLADKYQTSRSLLALSYIMSFPEISVTIPGIRTAEQARDNTGRITPLSAEDLGQLCDLYDTGFSQLLDQMQLQG